MWSHPKPSLQAPCDRQDGFLAMRQDDGALTARSGTSAERTAFAVLQPGPARGTVSTLASKRAGRPSAAAVSRTIMTQSVISQAISTSLRKCAPDGDAREGYCRREGEGDGSHARAAIPCAQERPARPGRMPTRPRRRQRSSSARIGRRSTRRARMLRRRRTPDGARPRPPPDTLSGFRSRSVPARAQMSRARTASRAAREAARCPARRA